MNLSKDVAEILQEAILYAEEFHYEYVTPEMLLHAMCANAEFSGAFEECGGDIGRLSRKLEDYCRDYIGQSEKDEPQLSLGVTYAFAYAGEHAANGEKQEIGIVHLIHAIWRLPDSYAVYFMEEQEIDPVELLRVLADREEEEEARKTGRDKQEENPPEETAGAKWRQYAPCLNDELENVNPLIGREAELERTIQILCRKDKNNPLHIGEPGVGKTAVTYGLAQRINEGRIPEQLKGSRIFALDLGGMIAGTQYRGDFEKRLKKVLNEIGKEEKPIIYIDEIHNLAGAGAVGESSYDAANMLKPYLSAGHIRFIGATTFEEYKKYFEKSRSLVRRFQNVEIKEPDEKETVQILKGLKSRYEKYHGVTYKKGVLEYAVSMSAKYIHERFLPDKAIDLIDEAGAYRKLHPEGEGKQTVDKAVIAAVLTQICRVPVETVAAEETSGLASLEQRLKGRIFGQDEAVAQVVNAIKFSRAGLTEENRPLANLLFVGPTGVGKTEVTRNLAEELGVKLIRFDMSEYGEKHAVAKLIGSPAGYVGYEEGGLLTEEIRKNPSAVLLLDEIEKAHADIYNILLQVMDYATLTDNQGRKADFRNVVLIMTSNAGANRIGRQGIGFQSTDQDDGVLLEEVKRTFQPEFRNRLDKIVAFNGMNRDMASRIVEKKLNELGEMLHKKKISLETDPKAKELILKKGVSQKYGARELDRVIRNEIKPLFVDDILFGKLKKGGILRLETEGDSFKAAARKQEGSAGSDRDKHVPFFRSFR